MFVADYVLMEYGTGAIMAVPAHDERDFDFARAFGLEIRRRSSATRRRRGRREARAVRRPHRRRARWSTPASFDGDERTARRSAAIIEWLDERGRGEPAVNYRLRDWLLSRQRYWGCPIPVVHCERVRDRRRCPTTSSRSSCPTSRTTRRRARARSPPPRTGSNTDLPHVRRRRPAARPTRWTRSSTPSWYFLRYLDPRNDELPFEPRDRRPLDAGRPVHRRRRARDPAPDVRALLRQGARGHRLCSASRSRSPASSRRG